MRLPPLAIRDRRRIERRATASRRKCGSGRFVPWNNALASKNSRESEARILGLRAEHFFPEFCEARRDIRVTSEGVP
jgi:hypothetical protein